MSTRARKKRRRQARIFSSSSADLLHLKIVAFIITSAGVPQVILACWYDTMENAAKVSLEQVGRATSMIALSLSLAFSPVLCFRADLSSSLLTVGFECPDRVPRNWSLRKSKGSTQRRSRGILLESSEGRRE